jgi:hypothetical protein
MTGLPPRLDSTGSLEQFQDYCALAEFLRGCRSLMVASTLRIAFEVYQSWNCYNRHE